MSSSKDNEKHRNQKSIAVLPFVSYNENKEDDYFADGFTEELINALTTIKGLKVIARTSSFSFKDKNIDVRKIGEQLGVSTILEGSIRKSKNKIRITAQLVKADDGTHYWSKNFDRELEDVFVLQDEISLLIADQIRENFGHFIIQDHLIVAPTNNLLAYNLYLKARHHHLKWNPEDLRKGVRYYEESTQVDPTFALPYFGAALTYGINASWGFMPFDEGIRAAGIMLSKGLQINSDVYLGYFARGTVSLWGHWDFKSGYEYLSKAVKLNPSFTDAEEALAELFIATGDLHRALEHTENILSLNPLSPNHHYTAGTIHYLSKQYKKAIAYFETSLELDPQFALSIEMIALCYIHLKSIDKLLPFLKKHPTAEEPKKCLLLFKAIYPEIDFPIETLSQTKPSFSSSLIPWDLYLNVHYRKHNEAFKILEQGIKIKGGQFINFKSDPFLTPLHQNRKFNELINAVFNSQRLPNSELNLKENKNSIKPLIAEHEAQDYLEKLKQLLLRENLFLDANLSLKKLAEHLQIHPNKLSWLLNEYLGKNFNELINSYRLESFKKKAVDPSNNHLTLLALAYESGFNSKSVFNAFFKKTEGTTPRAWLKNNSPKF